MSATDEVALDGELDAARLPLSALNHLVFCERRCALIHIEGVFVQNAFTVEGTLAHEAADLSGYEVREGVRMLHALPLWSARLKLSGKADIIEFRPNSDGSETPFPVEYKRGRRNRWQNDDVQLCAQALCLEEILLTEVPRGAIFHVSTKRRREVEFTRQLRDQTEAAVSRLHELMGSREIPPAVLMPKCEGCSLHEICMPELSLRSTEIEAASAHLFRF
ncbi:MAG: CRISPR-associated exonuclease Cas4 [Bryobacterales bacterium]|jgi:CRISPR-associated exonuclease Cas4|nr:CRISPR-associated exonuclease Cas4 [Bryobacterales bacterium]